MDSYTKIQIDEVGTAPQFEILADNRGSFTYASFQNAVPVIRSIAVNNGTSEQREHCELRLRSDPPFLRQKTWHLDRLLRTTSGRSQTVASNSMPPI